MKQTLMSLRDFVDEGYLIELNRQFLHPLGLALAVDIDAEQVRFIGISDARDDPEGLIYGPGELTREDAAKGERLTAERSAKARLRLEHFGWIVQPLPG